MNKNNLKIAALALAGALFGNFSLMAMEQVRGKRGQALQIEQKQAASAEQGFGIGLEVKAGVAEVKADAEAKIEAAQAGQVKPLRSLCADAINADMSPDELLKFYQLGIRLHEQGIIAAVIKALPDALVRVAEQDGMQAVKKFLDEAQIAGSPEEEKNWKDMLLNQCSLMRYSSGEPEQIGTINCGEQVYPEWNAQDVLSIIDGNNVDLYDNIIEKSVRSHRLQHNVPVKMLAWHSGAKQLIVLAEDGVHFWYLHEGQWQKNETIVLQNNDRVVSVRWINEESIIFAVTNAQTQTRLTLQYWHLENRTLKFSHENILNFERNVINPQISWSNSSELAFMIDEGDEEALLAIAAGNDYFRNCLCDYYGGNWRVKELEQELYYIFFRHVWDVKDLKFRYVTFNYNMLGQHIGEKKYANIWFRNKKGEWEVERQELQAPFIKRVSLDEDRLAQSPSGNMLVFFDHKFDYLGNPIEWAIYLLHLEDNIWRHQGSEFNVSSIFNRAKPLISWNNKGNLLAILTADRQQIRILSFDVPEKLSLQEFLLSLVAYKLKNTPAGKALLARNDSAFRSFADKSPALKKALRIEPKWYTKAYFNRKVNTISKWMRRHPKTTLALCAAGAVVAYYARKHKWVKRSKTAVYDPLVAYLKRRKTTK